MNRDDVIKMAREAGWPIGDGSALIDSLSAFAQLVAAHEREECAKVCESEHLEDPQDREDDAYDCAVNDCVRAIRARGTA